MEHLKQNVEDLSDDKIFEEMIKIVQEKSLQKFSKLNKEMERKTEEKTSINEASGEDSNFLCDVKIEMGESAVDVKPNQNIENDVIRYDKTDVYDRHLNDEQETEGNIGQNNSDLLPPKMIKKEETENLRNILENSVEIEHDDDDDDDDVECLDDLMRDNSCTSRLEENTDTGICYRSRTIPLERCPYCMYRANHDSHIRTHISTVHASLTCFRCPLCPASSSCEAPPTYYSHSQLSVLFGHIERKHHNRRYECPKCRQKFTTLWNCEGHVAIRHPANRKNKKLSHKHLNENARHEARSSEKQCPYCEFKGPTTSSIRKHAFDQHASCIVYKCSRCDFRAEPIEEMRRHVDEQHFDTSETELD